MRGPAADHTHRVEIPGLQFSDCQPCRKSGAARRPDRGPGSGVGREKRAPWGTRPAQPGRGAKPGHRPRAPRSPQRGRRGGGGRRGEPHGTHSGTKEAPASPRRRGRAARPRGAQPPDRGQRPRAPRGRRQPPPKPAKRDGAGGTRRGHALGRGGGGAEQGRPNREPAAGADAGARTRRGQRAPAEPRSGAQAAERRSRGGAPGGGPGERSEGPMGRTGPAKRRRARRAGAARAGAGAPAQKGPRSAQKRARRQAGPARIPLDGDEAQRRSRAARVGPLRPRAPGRSPPHYCGGCGAVEAPQCAPGPEGERGPPRPRWRAAPWAGGRGAPPLGGAREAGGRSPISSASRASFT